MDKTIDLLKSLLLPILEEDLNFHRVKLNDAFWDFLIKCFLNYEEDAKPTRTMLYALQLNEPELVLNQLPQLFNDFINESAENYVLGSHNNATAHLIAAQNPTFLARVSFFQTLVQAIKKVERENIKSTLPKYFDRLTFEVSDIELENVTKKRGREDLKSKFKEWDQELEVSTSMVLNSMKEVSTEVSKTKVFSLSWVKYAVAACFVLGGSLWFYQNTNPEITPNSNSVVVTDEDTTIVVKPKVIPLPSEESIQAVAYTTKEKMTSVQYPSDFGFTSSTNSKMISIIFKDASQSIKKLQNMLEGIMSERINPEVVSKTNAIKDRLDKLTLQQGRYEFDGKQLIVYTKDLDASFSIVSQDDKTFYIKMNTIYHQLNFTKQPSEFTAVKDKKQIEQLEKITFQNEE